jgi:uncharacterized membrane protein YgaE (UPF0421/DUF939 family)
MKALRTHRGPTAIGTVIVAALLVFAFGEAGVVLAVIGIIVVILALLDPDVTGWKL